MSGSFLTRTSQNAGNDRTPVKSSWGGWVLFNLKKKNGKRQVNFKNLGNYTI